MDENSVEAVELGETEESFQGDRRAYSDVAALSADTAAVSAK
jgi:hypothetical protein